MKHLRFAACALAAAFVSIGHAQQPSFEAWLQDVRSAAIAAHISAATVDAAFAGIAPIDKVIERDRSQPELTLDFRGYITRVVSPSRIEEGQRVFAEQRELLERVGTRNGMPPELLAAVWGIESNYGRTQGDFPVVAAPARLGCDGRRGAMFRKELLNAQPHRHLGQRCRCARIGGELHVAELEAGAAMGRQVTVPARFNMSLAGLGRTRTLAPRENVVASIVFPDKDAREPAFLVYQNYRALMRWNRSNFFAIAVGHLSDRIAGGPPLAGF